MDNKKYLKDIISDKKVIRSLVVILICCVAIFFLSGRFESPVVNILVQFVCYMIMFFQFPAISSAANKAYAEQNESKEKKK